MIKLESLRVFVRVAESGNIREAARKLNRTQSAISMSLKQLEEEVGSPLFESDRKSTLTALGRFMLETASLQISTYDQSINSIRAFAKNRIGKLTVASVPSMAANLIPDILPEFIAALPEIEVELLDLDSRGVRRMVENGQADFGIAGIARSTSNLKFTPLFTDHFKLVCKGGSALADAKNPIQLRELANEALILNGASDNIEDVTYQTLAGDALLTVRNVTSLFALVRAGLGVTLLPELATRGMPEGLIAVDLRNRKIARQVGLIEREGTVHSPVAYAFRDFLLRVLPDILRQKGFNMTPPETHISPNNLRRLP